MGADLVVAPKGLTTNPSQLLAGGGGLSECSNALCRRPGMIEPRGAFYVYGNSAVSGSGQYITEHVAPYGSNTFLVTSNGSSASALMQGTDYANRLGLSQANLTPRSALLGQSQAFVLDGGIRMMDDSTANPSTGAARFCGVPRPVGWSSVGANSGTASWNWLTTGYSTAYRAVWVRTINGREYYSPPTDRRVVINTSGSTEWVYHTFALKSYHTGWTLKIYRSPTMQLNGTPPSDEMRLIQSYTMTASDVAATSYVFSDILADGAWNGATIYTAGTQEGLARAYYAPGYANDCATYNGMAFLGGHRRGHQVSVQVKALGDSADTSATLCSVKFGATAASGSPTLTGVTAAALPYLAVGQMVNLAATLIPGAADASFLVTSKVLSINTGAATVTLDKNAQTTGAITVVAWDWIKVTGTNVSRYVYAGWVDKVGATTFSAVSYVSSDVVRTNGVFSVIDNGANNVGFTGGTHEIERAFGSINPVTSSGVEIQCWSTVDAVTPKYGGLLTFAEVAVNDTGGATTLGTNSFTVTSTKPNAFSRYLDATTGVTSTVDGGSNVLAWSELDRPESFPLPYFQQIGSASNVIDRVVATSDSLFVFTREGTYRTYGVTPDNLSTGAWDPTCRTFSSASGWVTRHGDSVYAWTLRGIVEVTSSGVTNIDEPIKDIVRKYQPNLVIPSVTGAYAGPDEQTGLVVFGAQFAVGEAPFTLVYSTLSGTWQRFNSVICGSRFTISAAARATNGSLLVGTKGTPGYALYLESPYNDVLTSSYPYRGDFYATGGTFTNPSVSLVNSATWTINVGSTVVDIAVGDMLIDSAGSTFYVTASNGTSITVHTTGGHTGAIGIVAKAFPTTITYVASAEGLPMMDKRFTDITLNFGMLRYGRTYAIATGRYGESSTTSQTVTYDADLTTYAPYTKAVATRRTVPVAQGRGIALAVTFSQTQAQSYWQLMALNVMYEPVTTLVNRGQT